MKIQFDISKRPQIESGEYKVETECGHPVSIMDWEWIDRHEKKCLAVKVLMDEGFNIGYLFDYDGKRHSIFHSDSDSDLFIITPEPELSEWETFISGCLQKHGLLDCGAADKIAKECSSELLDLARKELEPEVLERLEIAYKNQDDVVYENGKREGKAEALKDLPRWKPAARAYEGDRLPRIDWLLNRLVAKFEEGIFYLDINDLYKLPGFND